VVAAAAAMAGLIGSASAQPAAAEERVEPRVIEASVTLTEAMLADGRPLLIRGRGVVIDGDGLTLTGPGRAGDLATFVGAGLRIEDAEDVTVRDLKVHGFRIGLAADRVEGLTLVGCDFSDNYHDPDFGWGDGERVGGIVLTDVRGGRIADTTAERNWNGLDLLRTTDLRVTDSDFSHCSNVGVKLEESSRNAFVGNDIAYGIRIRPGEVHARDSTGVLLESGSNDNLFENNDMTHGGNGFFIRVLNGWVSTGNRIIGNDASHANNNGFESWSPGNVYLDNVANHCSYGFWLGGSDQTVLRGNTAAYNGTPEARQNAPEPDFGHGGIVIVNGPGSNTVIEDNHVHHNQGGGIVFRGDRVSRGEKWPFFHVLVQNNRIEHNRYGVFTAFADWVRLAGNTFEGNQTDVAAEAVTDLTRIDDVPSGATPPEVAIEVLAPADAAGEGRGDRRAGRVLSVTVGDEVRLRASGDTANTWKIIAGGWDGPDREATGETIAHRFDETGFYRVGLMAVAHSGLASLDWRHVYVTDAERGVSESSVSAWSVVTPGTDAPAGEVVVGEASIVGASSVRFDLAGHAGRPFGMRLAPDGGLALDPEGRLSFWLKTENANIAGFRGPTPTIRLVQGERTMTYLPTRQGVPRHLLIDPPYSEARQGWTRVAVDLAGSDAWSRYETVGGDVPPYVDPATDLAFVTVRSDFATQDDTGLVSAGGVLYMASIEGQRFVESRDDGATWRPLPSPARQLAATFGGWRNGMLAYAAELGGRGSLLIRHVVGEANEHGFNPARIARFDLADRRWSWLSADVSMNLGATVVEGDLYGIARARAGDYGGALTRMNLADPGELEQRTVIAGLGGHSPWWFGSATQLVGHRGRVFGIKNDWASPQPTPRDEVGDRLFVIDPADWNASRFLGGNYDGQRRWEAAETPAGDLGPIPFEIGNGACLAALPAGWGGVVGDAGGLFVVAGSSPADHEGNGSPSKHYAIYDIASGAWTPGTLPAETATGTSIAFHGEDEGGRVVINRGGMNFPSSNQQLWWVSPATEATRAEASVERASFDFGAVEAVEVQMQSNGGRPVDVWIDGVSWD
jgi:parallel beta-helix repeat protein